MRFYVHDRDVDGDTVWVPIYAEPTTSVREVFRRIAKRLHPRGWWYDLLDDRDIPESDLVTERGNDLLARWRTLPYEKQKASRAKRVNLPYAYAADLRVAHVPLLAEDQKLYLVNVSNTLIGVKDATHDPVVRTTNYLFDNDDHYYTCDTAAVRSDGTPPPLHKRKIAETDVFDGAEECHLALNELSGDKDVLAFGPDGEITKVYYHWESMDDYRVAEAVSYPDDPSAIHVKVPPTLFRGIFSDAPKTVVTIGDARALRDGTLEPFMVVQCSQCTGFYLFGPDDDNFNSDTVLSNEMDNVYIDDDEEFTWGSGGNCLIKITPALVDWARNVVATMELLGSPSNREVMRSLDARLAAIERSSQETALDAKIETLRTKQDGIPGGERRVAHCELELEIASLLGKMFVTRATVALEKAKVLEEWDNVRERMLAAKAKAQRTKQPRINAALAA